MSLEHNRRRLRHKQLKKEREAREAGEANGVAEGARDTRHTPPHKPSAGGAGALVESLEQGTGFGLVNQAARNRWEIPDSMRETIPQKLREIVDGDYPASTRIKATNTLAALEAQNQRDDHKRLDKQVPDLHEHEHVSHEEVRRVAAELTNDDDYLDFLRERAVLEDSQATSD